MGPAHKFFLLPPRAEWKRFCYPILLAAGIRIVGGFWLYQTLAVDGRFHTPWMDANPNLIPAGWSWLWLFNAFDSLHFVRFNSWLLASRIRVFSRVSDPNFSSGQANRELLVWGVCHRTDIRPGEYLCVPAACRAVYAAKSGTIRYTQFLHALRELCICSLDYQ